MSTPFLSCFVCAREYDEPVTFACSHSFCREPCASDALARASRCPQCKAPVPSELPPVNAALRDALAAMSSQVRSGAAIPASSLPSSPVRRTSSSSSLPSSPSRVPWSDISFDRDDDGERVAIGKGSFGIVFAARLGSRPVAVKVVNVTGAPVKIVEDFWREVGIQHGLRHDNIVAVEGASERAEKSNGAVKELALVLTRMDGGSLDKWFEPDAAPRSLPERLRVLRDVARGVAYMHECGVVHADVKPANVLFDGDGNARVCDFGLARLREEGDATRSTLKAERGTPIYMDPAIGVGRASLKKASDTFSLAIMAWEVLAGVRAFVAQDAAGAELRPLVRGGLRPDLSRLPAEVAPSLAGVFEAMWDPVQARRPAVAVFLEAVERLLPSSSSSSSSAAAEARGGLLKSPASAAATSGWAVGLPRGQESGDASDLASSRFAYDVLLSHAWGDEVPAGTGVYPLKAKAFAVADALRAAGLSVWIDTERLPHEAATSDVSGALGLAIIQSRVIVLCVSPAYARSANCRMEAQYASRRRKPICVINVGEQGYETGAYSDFDAPKLAWLDLLVMDRLYADARTASKAAGDTGYAQLVRAVRSAAAAPNEKASAAVAPSSSPAKPSVAAQPPSAAPAVAFSSSPASPSGPDPAAFSKQPVPLTAKLTANPATNASASGGVSNLSPGGGSARRSNVISAPRNPAAEDDTSDDELDAPDEGTEKVVDLELEARRKEALARAEVQLATERREKIERQKNPPRGMYIFVRVADRKNSYT